MSQIGYKAAFFGTLFVLIFLLIVMNKQDEKVLSIYTAQGDIVYVNLLTNDITYESKDTIESFNSFEGLNERIEELTAESSVISGYAEDLRYNIEEENITLEVTPLINENGKVISPVGEVKMIYQGPNWGINPEQDTTFTISTLKYSEERNITFDEFDNIYHMYTCYYDF